MQVLLELHNRGFGYGLGRKVRRSFSWHPAQRRIDVIRDLVERNYTSSSLRYDMIQACRNSDVYASFWGVCCGLGRVAGAEVVRKCANVDAAPAPRRRPRASSLVRNRRLNSFGRRCVHPASCDHSNQYCTDLGHGSGRDSGMLSTTYTRFRK